MEDITGKQLGPYRVVAPLGEGGMAAVYKAYQPGMDRYVALKILPRHFASDPQFAARFQQEAKVIANLQNPHILPVHDFGEADGYTYIVMPYVEGGTLASLLRGQPLPLEQMRSVISQVGDALDYAHSRGLVHRDVKPSNVLVDERGNCLLTDFGIAKIVEGNVKLTNTGGILGTPAYMSPEQGLGQKLDGRSDIYALGVILYEMATGRIPYNAETPMGIVTKHITDPLPPPRSVNPGLPEAVERVILKALAKNADDRYQTARAMVEALDDAMPAEESHEAAPQAVIRTAPPQREVPKPRRTVSGWVWVALAVAIVGCIGLGFLSLTAILASGFLGGGAGSVPTATALAPSPTATPTSTSIPTSTSSAVSAPSDNQGRILFEDDFSDTSSGWDQKNSDTGITDYSGGSYRILVNQTRYDAWANPGQSFTGDVSVEVDATKNGGPDDNDLGVICRYQDVDNFYVFEISSDGYAVIGKMTAGNSIEYISSDKMESTDAIHQGIATNHIRADCIGDTLTLYVNGAQVATVTDTDHTSGDVGLMAGTFDTAGADILFDNFVVRAP